MACMPRPLCAKDCRIAKPSKDHPKLLAARTSKQVLKTLQMLRLFSQPQEPCRRHFCNGTRLKNSRMGSGRPHIGVGGDGGFNLLIHLRNGRSVTGRIGIQEPVGNRNHE